jgi:hypothetical protein
MGDVPDVHEAHRRLEVKSKLNLAASAVESSANKAAAVEDIIYYNKYIIYIIYIYIYIYIQKPDETVGQIKVWEAALEH